MAFGLVVKTPVVSIGFLIEVPKAILSLEPFTLAVTASFVASVPQATLSLEPYTPTVLQNHIAEIPKTVLSLEPYAPIIGFTLLPPQVTLGLVAKTLTVV